MNQRWVIIRSWSTSLCSYERFGHFWQCNGGGKYLGAKERCKRQKRNQMRIMWIHLQWQLNMLPNHKITLWMVVMMAHLVLLNPVLAHLCSLEAPILTGNHHELPANTNKIWEPAQVKPPWPKLQCGISTNGRKWLIPTQCCISYSATNPTAVLPTPHDSL